MCMKIYMCYNIIVRRDRNMKKQKSTRDTWIPETWRYNGAGYQKNKKAYTRKKKHKKCLTEY